MDNVSMRSAVLAFAGDNYGTEPEYLWESSPDYAVLRRKDNSKWYGIIMDVPCSRLGIGDTGKVDILDIKVDPLMLGSLLSEEGFLPAYHMNKQNWITVLLDGTVDREKIFMLIDMSYGLAAPKSKAVRKPFC